MNEYSLKTSPRGYYVYQYLRDKDSAYGIKGTPYYVGKGTGKRAWYKASDEIPIPKLESNIVIISDNLTNEEACLNERLMIKQFGRIDINTGILRNKTDGGDGISSADATRKNLQMRRDGIHPSQIKWTCEHCGKSGTNAGLLTRWHNNNCPSNKENPNYGKKRLIPNNPFSGGEIQRRTAAAGGLHFQKKGVANEINRKRISEGTFALKWACEHCDKTGKGFLNYKRWHGDNCKSR